MTPRSLRITRLRGAGGSLTVDYGAALRVQEALRSRRRHGADSGEIIPRLVDDLLHRVVLCTACADCHTVALCTGPLDRPGQLSREMVETSAREHEEYEMKMAMGSAKSAGAGKQRLRTVLSAVHKLASSRAAGPDEPAEAREAAQLTEPPTPAADHKAEISALLSAPEGGALDN